jgi:hypothetical protein
MANAIDMHANTHGWMNIAANATPIKGCTNPLSRLLCRV